MPAETTTTTVGKLHVHIEGEGPPAVLWHSLFVDSTSWELLRPALARHRRLIVIDGPGHGRSGPPPGPFSIDSCATAATEVLDQLDVTEPVDWVGNAWGGHVGLTLAAAAPSRCRTVTTIGTPVQALTTLERLTRIRPLVALYAATGATSFLMRTMTDALLGAEAVRAHPELAERVLAALRDADTSAMLQAMHSVMLGRKSLKNLLPTITTPTLMVAGRDDGMWDDAMAAAAVATMPLAATLAVRGSGHIAPLLLEAELLSQVLPEFWRSPTHYLNSPPARRAAAQN